MPRTRKYVMKRKPKKVSRRRLQTKTVIPTLDRYSAAGAALAGNMVYNAARRKFTMPTVNVGGVDFATMSRKPGSRTRTKRVKGDEGTGGYSQWSQRYQQAIFGKLTPKKIDKLSNDTVILRHQRIGPFNDYGQRYMYNALDINNNLYYPLVLFELNSVNNYISGGQTLCCPAHHMYQPAGTTNIAWEPLLSQAEDGTVGATNPQWRVEKSGHTNSAVASHPMEQSIHKWTSLDLELWGQTSKPTLYTIYLCQLHEDVVPPSTSIGGVVQYATITDQNAAEFWQSMVKRYVYSPLAKIDDGFGNKKIKIMKQYKVNIDPTATYENDPDPHVKTMKLFYRFNRKCNFQWSFSGASAQSIANMNDADWQQEDGENRCQVHPNARLFVMIRASNYVRGNTASPSNATMPSISWVMRSAHLINQ